MKPQASVRFGHGLQMSEPHVTSLTSLQAEEPEIMQKQPHTNDGSLQLVDHDKTGAELGTTAPVDSADAAAARRKIHIADDLNVVPSLSAEQYAALKSDIERRRQVLVPIEIDLMGRILDGRARWLAAQELGITDVPIIVRVITDEREIKEHIRVLNACRRNLTNAQKREIIKAQLLDHPEYADRHVAGMLFVDNHTVSAVRGDLETNGEIPVVTQVVAKNGNVYKRLPVMMAKPRAAERLVSALGHLDPSVTSYVGGSHLCDTPGQLLELAAQPPQIQRSVVEKLENGSRRRVKRLARQVKKDLRVANCTAPDYDGSFDLDTISHADIRDLAENLDLPAECAHLLVADAPWDHAAVPLYGSAARLAQHVLKPGGTAAFLIGKAHVDEVMSEITPYLEWRWMLAEFQPESEQRCYPLPVFSKFRPTLIFWKPGPSAWTEWVPDGVWAPREKDFHPWQQSSQTMRLIVSAMTPVGGVVIDPMVGGGTVPAVAKALGRHFIGFDQDPEAVAITLERLNGIEFGSDLAAASAEAAGLELTA